MKNSLDDREEGRLSKGSYQHLYNLQWIEVRKYGQQQLLQHIHYFHNISM